ncbi:MAG: hypothetical protein HY054_11160 [Proteobacteria bacterium]|nr:hypothetical protein [Pseudomonadota bacterium]
MRFALLAAAILSTAACTQTQATQPATPSQTAAQPTAPTQPTTPPSSWVRLPGTVTAVSATQLTVRAANGTSTTVGFSPGWQLVVGHPISASDIHVGDFVATANANVDDHSGRSVELRVFPPGIHLGEGSRPMADGNTMTNGTVGEVTDVSGGRQMVVRFPGGQRNITLPSTIAVVGQRLADHSELAVGWNVFVLANPGENGSPPAAFYVYAPPAH